MQYSNTELVNVLKKNILTHVPDADVDKVVLFGSQLSNYSTAESDYDFLIILKNPHDWVLERKVRGECYNLASDLDFIADVTILNQSDLNSLRGKQPFVQNALKNGIAV